MKLCSVSKDGGPESHVWAYWLFEIKWLFSIVLLRFEDGSRDAYHDHAFNAVSWVLSGILEEDQIDSMWGVHRRRYHPSSLLPVFTARTTLHKVTSYGRTWVLSFRGPWAKTWNEVLPDGTTQTLMHGRKQM